jgi:hypothetical protein
VALDEPEQPGASSCVPCPPHDAGTRWSSIPRSSRPDVLRPTDG